MHTICPYNNLQQKFCNVHFIVFVSIVVVYCVMEFFGTKTPSKLLIQYLYIEYIEKKRSFKNLEDFRSETLFFLLCVVWSISLLLDLRFTCVTRIAHKSCYKWHGSIQKAFIRNPCRIVDFSKKKKKKERLFCFV